MYAIEERQFKTVFCMWRPPYLGRPTLVCKAVRFTQELSFLFFFINPPRSAAAHRWPSNVSRRFGRRLSFSNWYRDLAPPPSNNFHRVKNCEISSYVAPVTLSFHWVGCQCNVSCHILMLRSLHWSCGHYYEEEDEEFGVVFNITQLWAARVWKCNKISERWNFLCSHDRPMSSPIIWWSWVHAPLRTVCQSCLPHPLKLHGENVVNHQ